MLKIITIPFNRNIRSFEDEILEQFAMNKHITNYHAEFFSDGSEKYWTILIEYDSVFEKTSPANAKSYKKQEDYGLDETQNVLMERLRKWRRERAEKEGVPVYLLGTNSELADVIRTAPKSLEALANIRGFGKSKVKKYGNEIIGIIKAFYDNQPPLEKKPSEPAGKEETPKQPSSDESLPFGDNK